MPKSYRQTMAFLVCTSFAVAAAAAHATTCWIDHVEKSDGGVRLFFIQRDHMIVNGTITGQNDKFVVVNGGRLLRTDPSHRGPLLNYLALHDGDRVELWQPAADRCTLSVVDNTGRVGVLAQTSPKHYGAPSVVSDQFIAADTVAVSAASTAPNVPQTTQTSIGPYTDGYIVLRIGDSVQTVQGQLRAAIVPQPSGLTPGSTVITLATRGIRVFFDKFDKVDAVRFTAPFVGRIGGARIGESRQVLRETLGDPLKLPPTRTLPGLSEPYLYRLNGHATVRFDFDPSASISSIVLLSGMLQFRDTNERAALDVATLDAQSKTELDALSKTKQAPGIEFGMFFGATASQYDLCVQKGLIPVGKQSAEETARSILETMEQHNHDPDGMAGARKGWDVAKREIAKRSADYTQQRCDEVAAQWNRYVAMMRKQ